MTVELDKLVGSPDTTAPPAGTALAGSSGGDGAAKDADGPGDVCGEHGATLQYYCVTCSEPVCSDCAMFGSEHKGHTFERIAKVYEQQVVSVRAAETAVRKRLDDLAGLMAEAESSIDSVTASREEREAELHKSFKMMQERLDGQLRGKMNDLVQQKTLIEEEMLALKEALNRVLGQLNSTSKSRLISRSNELAESLQAVLDRPTVLHSAQQGPLSFDIVSEVVPRYACGEFWLRPYSKLREHETNVVYSETLLAHGTTWRLKVYPNGNGMASGAYLSVFLEMTKGVVGEASTYEYRIEMVNHLRSFQPIVREFASDFDVGECWGYNKFFRIDLLGREGYLHDDTIVLKFYVRAPTYQQQARDQANYIETMHARLSGLEGRSGTRRSSSRRQKSRATQLGISSVDPGDDAAAAAGRAADGILDSPVASPAFRLHLHSTDGDEAVDGDSVDNDESVADTSDADGEDDEEEEDEEDEDDEDEEEDDEGDGEEEEEEEEEDDDDGVPFGELDAEPL